MRRSLSFLLFIMLAAVASAERTLDLGVISRVATGKTVPVAWEVHSRAIEPLLNKAFASYGGFVRVSPEQAAVKIDLSALSTEAVRLELVKDDAVIYSEDFSGSSLSGAALAAADRAVEKIMGLPGFFSGKIAFISDKTGSTEVYVSDLFFQNIQRITTDGALATGPKLSPDGRYLNYTSYCRGGFPDLLKVDLKTLRRATLAGFDGLNTGGNWSPTGDRVAAVLSVRGNPEVFIVDPDKGLFHRLTRTASIEASPSFSPDGLSVVFASDAPGRPQLYSMKLSDEKMQRIPTNISSYCAEPVWNPIDPNFIAFTVASGKQFEVALYSMAERKSTILTSGSGDAIEPVWMRDGRHLIYTARTKSTRQLCLLDTQTGKSTVLNSTKFGKAWAASTSAR